MPDLAPIVLFVYNRPWHTKKTVEALQKNELASESNLIIYSDAAKQKKNINQVKNVREYIKSIDGFKKVTIIQRDKNFGLADSIIDGVTDVIKKHKKIIVLEDDLVTSKYFLQYMNDALIYYQNYNDVISVHGWMWPNKDFEKEPPFFLRGADCWGWATWKRGWDLFEPDGSSLLEQFNTKKIINKFNYNGHANYIGMLEDQINKKNDSWAIRWYASAFLSNKFTLYPGVSLINNIGRDGSGTHSVPSNEHQPDLSNNAILIDKKTVCENKLHRISKEKYYKKMKGTYLSRILNKLNMFIQ